MTEMATSMRGTVSLHPRGFGFVEVREGEAARTGEGPPVLTAFVPPPELNPFLADDVVDANVTRLPDGRYSASGLKLVSRARELVYGEVVPRRGTLFLKIDRDVANTDWPLDASGEAVKPGDNVIARVGDRQLTLVRTVEGAHDRTLERLIARYALPSELLPEARNEVPSVLARPHTPGGRRDLRETPTVTVDAPSTRDIDDAISVLPAGPDGALRLLVSIADVAEFITEGSALDRSARDRATSVYLAGRVIPMLPEEASSHWLSLVPGEDRLCLTVEMRIDPEGRVTSADVYESVIRSWARLNYTEVAAFLDRHEVSPAMEPVRAAMPWFRTAMARLGAARARRGGVEITREESRVVFDTSTGMASGFENVHPTSAHDMIERFMVAANEAIARWFHERGVPALYRVHDEPDAERIADLAAFARNFGYEAGFGKKLTPDALAAFDEQIRTSPSEPALRSVLRRALGPARYTVSPLSHFGLAAPLYLHFTSPIRRYADLWVHRAIKQYLRGRRDFVSDDPGVETLAAHLNFRARAAGRAESARRRSLSAQVMAPRVGELFSARITRVRVFGLVVQVDDTLVEGTIAYDALPNGPYEPDARETCVTGPGGTYTIGMPVRVKLVSTDAVLGRIDFAPA